jgi:hypothetical protein
MEAFLAKLKELLKEVEGVDMNAIETELKNLVGSEDDKQRLIAKNKDLIAEKRTLQEKVKSLEEQVGKFDVEEFKRLQKFEEDTIASGDTKVNIEDIKSKVELKWKNQLGVKDQELEALKAQLNSVNGELENLLVDQELDKQFVSGKRVIEAHRPMLKVFFKSKVKVEKDGDDRVVYIKDNGQELPIADYFEFWKGTADAKTYLEADVNTGGGASGSKSGFKTKKPWKEMSPAERVTLYQENPAEYARMKAENSKK